MVNRDHHEKAAVDLRLFRVYVRNNYEFTIISLA